MEQPVQHSSATIDPAFAEQTLQLAARLQEEARQSLTVDDLTRIAEEAGIESRFVHEALSRQLTGTHQPVPQTPRIVMAAEDRVAIGSASLAVIFANVVINSRVFAENLFTTLPPGAVLIFALALAFCGSMALGKLLPRAWVRAPWPVLGMVVLAIVSRVQSNYGWDLSFGPHTTLAVVMLLGSCFWGYVIGWSPWKSSQGNPVASS